MFKTAVLTWPFQNKHFLLFFISPCMCGKSWSCCIIQLLYSYTSQTATLQVSCKISFIVPSVTVSCPSPEAAKEAPYHDASSTMRHRLGEVLVSLQSYVYCEIGCCTTSKWCFAKLRCAAVFGIFLISFTIISGSWCGLCRSPTHRESNGVIFPPFVNNLLWIDERLSI